MGKSFNVVVVGPETLVGEAVLTLLDERDFPVSSISLVSEEGGGRIEFKGKHIKVQSLIEFDFSEAEIAFFCLDEEIAEAYVPKAADTGCIVIDDSPCFRLEDDVPLVVPEVNAGALAGFRAQRIVANPSTCSLMLVTALKPFYDSVGVDKVNVVTLQAVSGRDKAGVEALAKQTTAMFNMKPIETEVFPAQIAFNLIPQVGDFCDDGSTREETKIIWESQKLLNDDKLAINATAIRVPVFHGHSMVLNIKTKQEISAEDARSLLQNTPGIMVIDELEDGAYPMPVGDTIGQDRVCVGRIRKDLSEVNSLNLWLVADNIRKGAALNSVQNAEILIKEYLN